MDNGINSRNCKNCGHLVSEDYCGKCGQSIHLGRINWHYLLHEFQHSVLHVDKGIFYTIRELLFRPKVTIEDYLDGKRMNHFKPFAFVIILGTIYGFISYYLGYYIEPEFTSYITQDKVAADIVKETSRETMDWVHSHYSLTMLVFLPFSALASYFVFRNKGYNYFEHLIIYAYITGIQIFLLLILYPVLYFLNTDVVYTVTFVIIYAYNIFVIAILFKKNSWAGVISKAVVSIALAFVILVIVSSIIILCLMIKSTNF